MHTLLATRLIRANVRIERIAQLNRTLDLVLEVAGYAALVLMGHVVVWNWLLNNLIVR